MLSSPIPEIESVSSGMNNLLLKCLSNDPSQRFDQFLEVQKEIEILREQLISRESKEPLEQPVELEKNAEKITDVTPGSPSKNLRTKENDKEITSLLPVDKFVFSILVIIIIAIILIYLKPWQKEPAIVSVDTPAQDMRATTLSLVKDEYVNKATDYINRGKFFSAETILLAGLGDFPGDSQLVELTRKNLVLKQQYMQDKTIDIEILNGAGVGGIAQQLSDYLSDHTFKVINTENYRENGRLNWDVTKSYIINHFGYNYQIEEIAKLVGIKTIVLDTLSSSESGADISVVLGKDYDSLNSFR
jgi:hypothetical protein